MRFTCSTPLRKRPRNYPRLKTRKKQKISQVALAKKMGVTQSRIAQVESGVGTSKVTFDVLLGILGVLGYDFKILPKKTA